MYSKKKINRLICVEEMITGIEAKREGGFYFAGESHNFWEAVFVESGKVTATADERIYHLLEGQLLFHKPGEYHRIWCEQGCDAKTNIISFTASGEGMKYFEKSCFDLTENSARQFVEITKLFSKATQKYIEKDMEKYNYFSNLAVSLLEMLLLRLTEKNKHKQKEHTESEEKYYQIVKIMKQNIDKNLSVKEIADLCSMSPSNMKLVFSFFSDIGIAKYFLNLRLRRACELLSEGKTATEAAQMLGFDEVNYFYKIFKREIGVTPKEYKISLKSNLNVETLTIL